MARKTPSRKTQKALAGGSAAVKGRLSQKEFAAAIGVTPQYVNKLVTQGKIVLVGSKVDVKQANAALAAFKRHGKVIQPLRAAALSKKKSAQPRPPRSKTPKAPKAPRKPAEGTITAHRTVREEFEAKLARTKYEQLSGSLVPAKDVLVAQQRQNANVRAKFRSLAQMMALTLSRETDPAEVQRLMLAEIDAILARLAEDPLAAAEESPQEESPDVGEPVALQTFAAAGAEANA